VNGTFIFMGYMIECDEGLKRKADNVMRRNWTFFLHHRRQVRMKKGSTTRRRHLSHARRLPLLSLPVFRHPPTAKMMSLVASPVVVARAAAPKRTARKPTAAIAQASVSVSSAGAKKIAFVGAVSLAMSASPALAAMELAFPAPQAQEIAMVADADDEKKAARKAAAAALAASLQKDFVAKVASEGKVVTSGTKPEKTKNLSFTGPSLSAPSFSNPFGGEKKAADSPAAPAAPVAAKEVSHSVRSARRPPAQT